MSYSIYADDSSRNHDEKWLKKYQMIEIFETIDTDTGSPKDEDLLLRTPIIHSSGYETVCTPSEILNTDAEQLFKSPGRSNMMLEACEAIDKDNNVLNIGNMLPPYIAYPSRCTAFDKRQYRKW